MNSKSEPDVADTGFKIQLAVGRQSHRVHSCYSPALLVQTGVTHIASCRAVLAGR